MSMNASFTPNAYVNVIVHLNTNIETNVGEVGGISGCAWQAKQLHATCMQLGFRLFATATAAHSHICNNLQPKRMFPGWLCD